MDCRPILLIVLLVSFPLAAEESALGPREGVLVLRNGHVVQGRILRLGDRYVVTFGTSSSEVRFLAGDVEFQCGSLEEAYARKQDILDPTSIRQRLDLAEWCLRHALPHRAADQLLAAQAINPFDGRARALRRRLFHIADANQIASQPQPVRSSDVDWQAIERVLETTPARAVEEYATSVQSLLLNRCGTNACHGSQANSRFHLMRPMKDSVIPRRLTQRNLHSTLQMIDFANPDNSPLLTIPRGPHGGEQQGLFVGRQEQQWDQLRNWVRLAAGPVDPTKRAAPMPPPPAGVPQDPTAAMVPSSASSRPAKAEVAQDEIHRSVFTRRPASAEPGVGYVPRDPFDPDVFNRRYFPEKFTPATANAPADPASKN